MEEKNNMYDPERGVDVEIYSYDETGAVVSEKLRCSYTKLYSGFLLLAWSEDPIMLTERIISATRVKQVILHSTSRRTAVLQKDTIATVWTTENSLPVKYMCSAAKVIEGFLVITSTVDAPNNKLYSTQIVIPSQEVVRVDVESKWKNGKT